MINKRELKEKAKKYETAAKYWKERLYKKERFSKYVKPHEIDVLVGKVVDRYSSARKIYKILNDDKKQEEIQSNILKLKEPSSSQRLRPRKLERQLGFAIPAIISFVVALCFISFNLTGNAIGGVSQNNSNWISVILFVLGMIFSFFYFRNQK